jgi:hypothetical protein
MFAARAGHSLDDQRGGHHFLLCRTTKECRDAPCVVDDWRHDGRLSIASVRLWDRCADTRIRRSNSPRTTGRPLRSRDRRGCVRSRCRGNRRPSNNGCRRRIVPSRATISTSGSTAMPSTAGRWNTGVNRDSPFRLGRSRLVGLTQPHRACPDCRPVMTTFVRGRRAPVMPNREVHSSLVSFL